MAPARKEGGANCCHQAAPDKGRARPATNPPTCDRGRGARPSGGGAGGPAGLGEVHAGIVWEPVAANKIDIAQLLLRRLSSKALVAARCCIIIIVIIIIFHRLHHHHHQMSSSSSSSSCHYCHHHHHHHHHRCLAIRSEEDANKSYEDFVKETYGTIEAKSAEVVDKLEIKAKK